MSLWSRIERRLTDLAGEIIPDEFREQVSAARELLEEGKAVEATEVLEALLAERPGHVGALSLVGHAHLHLGEPGFARGAFERALAERSDLPEALVGLGDAQLALGELDAAIESYRKTVKSAAGDQAVLAIAYRGLGIAFRRKGQITRAVRELRKAVAEDPNDALARGHLGEALLTDETISAEQARHHLMRALESKNTPVIAHLALGAIELADAAPDAATEYFQAGLDAATRAEDKLTAMLGLGDAAAADGDHAAAHRHYLEALAIDAKSAAVHARIADAHRAVDSYDEALASYERALAIEQTEPVLARALDTALRADAVETAVRIANTILDRNPNDPLALVARGVALAKEGKLDAARATFELALSNADTPEAHCALAQLELDADPARAAGTRAANAALAALRTAPNSDIARDLLAVARARELGDVGGADDGDEDDSEMYRLASALQRVVGSRSDLSDLTGGIAQAASDFDRPLLVTVMGEFSSGKSTFVNAFIGYDVAPTGITPTTATINVVKYGIERGGRILYRDGTIETIGWDPLFARLRALDADSAASIEVVEILLPLPQLERVNIVDTPGLNSILPEHEEVARAFIARADAVVWVFTAGQGGKKSERAALESIRSEGKRVLSVLNKMDQLRPREVEEVVGYIQGELEDIVELVVPFSARQALAHKNDGSGDDGNWAAIETALEQRFFDKARQLKREAGSRRLGGLLDRARARVMQQVEIAGKYAGRLLGAAAEVSRARAAFIDDVVGRERATINKDVGELYRGAAQEMLELVRPRSLPFVGSHSATRADRDYLVSLLDGGYEAALTRSHRRVVSGLRARAAEAAKAAADLDGFLGGDPVGDVERTGADAMLLLEARVFTRCRSYLQGYLRGGYVDTFFRRDVPKLELNEDAVYHALFRDAPNLDEEIAVRLALAGTGVLDAIAARLEHWAGVVEVNAYDLDVGISRALDSIDARRRGAVGP